MKKVLSIILILAIMLSCFPAIAFADSDTIKINNAGTDQYASEAITCLINTLLETTIRPAKSFSLVCPTKVKNIQKYTSLGDSLVFGFGLSDMIGNGQCPMFSNHFGIGVSSLEEKSYPLILAEKLGIKVADSEDCEFCNFSHPLFLDNASGSDNDFAQLAMGGIRAEDVLDLLNYSEDKCKENSTDYFNGQILRNLAFFYLHSDYSYENRKKAYQEVGTIMRNDVAASDLITLSIGGNNLGSFFTYAVNNNLMEQLDYEIGRYVKSTKVLNYILDLITELLNKAGIDASISIPLSYGFVAGNVVELAAKYLLYTYLSISVSVAKTVDTIHKINPKAIIAITGLYNPFTVIGEHIGNAKTKVEVGRLLGILCNAYNLSMKKCAVKHPSYCAYIDISKTDVIMYHDEHDLTISSLFSGDLFSVLLEDNARAAHETPEGHQYIADTIYNTLIKTTL